MSARGEVGAGKEPIFIRYLKRLAEKKTNEKMLLFFFFLLTGKWKRSTYFEVKFAGIYPRWISGTFLGTGWRGWAQRAGYSRPLSWPATRWRLPGWQPGECPASWKEVPPPGKAWLCPHKVCSWTRPAGKPLKTPIMSAARKICRGRKSQHQKCSLGNI